MLTCPGCGRRIASGDVKAGEFRCPGCNALLRLGKLPGPWRILVLLMAASLIWAVLKVVGVGEPTLGVALVLLLVPVSWACATLVLMFFPILERAPQEPEEGRTYVILPPRPPKGD